MKRDEGFTLVEIAVSLAIISISLVALLTAFNRAYAAAAENGVVTRAAMLAQEKLATAGNGPLPEEGEPKWEEDVRFPRYRFRKTVTKTPFRDVDLVSMTVQHDGKTETTMETYLIR